MTSFSCPHFAQHRDWCQRLDDLCVPPRLCHSEDNCVCRTLATATRSEALRIRRARHTRGCDSSDDSCHEVT